MALTSWGVSDFTWYAHTHKLIQVGKPLLNCELPFLFILIIICLLVAPSIRLHLLYVCVLPPMREEAFVYQSIWAWITKHYSNACESVKHFTMQTRKQHRKKTLWMAIWFMWFSHNAIVYSKFVLWLCLCRRCLLIILDWQNHQDRCQKLVCSLISPFHSVVTPVSNICSETNAKRKCVIYWRKSIYTVRGSYTHTRLPKCTAPS